MRSEMLKLQQPKNLTRVKKTIQGIFVGRFQVKMNDEIEGPEIDTNQKITTHKERKMERKKEGASFTKLTCVSDVTFGNFHT